jgi:outer membrane protein assembly factor BamB
LRLREAKPAGLALAALLLFGSPLALHAVAGDDQDKSSEKKKDAKEPPPKDPSVKPKDAEKEPKKKEKEALESPVLVQDAQALVDKLARKIDAAEWADVLTLAREIADKHPDDLVLGEPVADKEKLAKGALHIPARTALRRRLATIPAEGAAELARLLGDDPEERLAAARASVDPGRLLDAGDRSFFLDVGAEAILEAGDLYLEQGNLVAAAFAWRDVLDRHPNAGAKARAARRLVALLPLLEDPATARALRRAIRSSAVEPTERDALAALAKARAVELDETELADGAVTQGGAIAALGSSVLPVALRKKLSFEDCVPEKVDWRSPDAQNQTGDFGQAVPNVRRLLSSSAVTHHFLLLHLGRAILLFNLRNGVQLNWAIGRKRDLKDYHASLLDMNVLARFGVTVVDGDTVYATIRRGKHAAEEGGTVPRGTLIRATLPEADAGDDAEGTLVWDALASEPDEGEPPPPRPRRSRKKDKGASEPEPPELKEDALSFVGTPLVSGDRVFAGAWLAGSPNQTFVVALDAETGRILWKRALATVDSYNTGVQKWERPLPRVLPTPVLTMAQGALVALSNNGGVAALDPEDGRIVWARSYERNGNEHGPQNVWSRTPDDFALASGSGWNPVLALEDLGIVCPTDTEKLLLVRLSTGELLGQHARRHEGGVYRYLLGNWGSRIILEGDGDVVAYELEEVANAQFELTYKWDVKVDPHAPTEAGRGFLSGHWAVIPHETAGIIAVDVSSETRPSRRVVLGWQKPEREPDEGESKKPSREPGDLIVGEGRFCTIGARYAHVYSTKKRVVKEGE